MQPYGDNPSIISWGYVDASNNLTTIFCGSDYLRSPAKALWLSNGRNNLNPKGTQNKNTPDGENPDVCYGQVARGILSGTGTTIGASSNVWTDKIPARPPVRCKDYSLYKSCSQGNLGITCKNPIELIDNTPITPAEIGGCQTPPGNPISAKCPGCVALTTKDFVKVKLNDAIAFALRKMSEIHGCPTDDCTPLGNSIIRDDRKAVDLFHQILLFPIEHPKPEETELLLLAYRKMLDAIDNAFLTGQLTREENSPVFSKEVNMLFEVQDNMIQEAKRKGDYYTELYTSIEKANMLRFLDRREQTMSILNELAAMPDSPEKPYVDSWLCFMAAENSLLAGQITELEFAEKVMTDCTLPYIDFPAIPQVGKQEEDQEKLLSAKNVLEVSIAPNPAEKEFWITFNRQHSKDENQYTVRALNILGQEVFSKKISTRSSSFVIDVLKWEKVIYFIEVKDERTSKKSIQKIVVN